MNHLWKILSGSGVAIILVAIFFAISFLQKDPNESLSEDDISKISGCYKYKDQFVQIGKNGIYAKLANGDFRYISLHSRYLKRFSIFSNFKMNVGRDGKIYGEKLGYDIYWTIYGSEGRYYLFVEGNGASIEMKMSECA